MLRPKQTKKDSVYLDFASGTPVHPEVQKIMNVTQGAYANPRSIHALGQVVSHTIEQARIKVADLVNARPSEIAFTHGGSDGNCIAIMSTLEGFRSTHKDVTPHVITSTVEHPSVVELLTTLKDRGHIELSLIPVHRTGEIQLDALVSHIKENTALVSIISVNNETGTLQPMQKIAHSVRSARKENNPYPLLHVDMVQAPLFEVINMKSYAIDMGVLNAAKFYGPHGTGILYVREGVPMGTLRKGSVQHARDIDTGTPNTAGIVGCAHALDVCQKNTEKNRSLFSTLRETCVTHINDIKSEYPMVCIHGGDSPLNQAPHVINIGVQGITSERLVIELDARGYAVSAHTACQENPDGISSVIRALYQDEPSLLNTLGTIRISFGTETTQKQITGCMKALKEVIEKRKHEELLFDKKTATA